jgi:hypothetical protein
MAITIPQIMPATTMTTAARKLRTEAFIGDFPPLIRCPSIESASSRFEDICAAAPCSTSEEMRRCVEVR